MYKSEATSGDASARFTERARELDCNDSIPGQYEVRYTTSLAGSQKDLISQRTADAVFPAQQEKSADALVKAPSTKSEVEFLRKGSIEITR